MPKVYALVPARGGSKSLPQKNIRALNGKPVISYTLEAASQSGVFDEIIVSSDDSAILTEAKNNGVTADKRNPDLALDETPMAPVIGDLIGRRNLLTDDVIILLQPTSPLRNHRHIQDAWRCYQENNGDVLVSVYSLPNKYLKAYLRQDRFIKPLYSDQAAYSRRQDLPQLLMPNGAIYVFSVGAFQVKQSIPNTKVIPFVMTEEQSLDIDSESDLLRCSDLLKGPYIDSTCVDGEMY